MCIMRFVIFCLGAPGSALVPTGERPHPPTKTHGPDDGYTAGNTRELSTGLRVCLELSGHNSVQIYIQLTIKLATSARQAGEIIPSRELRSPQDL